MIEQEALEVRQGYIGAYEQIEYGSMMDVARADRWIELNPEQIVDTGVLNQMD